MKKMKKTTTTSKLFAFGSRTLGSRTLAFFLFVSLCWTLSPSWAKKVNEGGGYAGSDKEKMEKTGKAVNVIGVGPPIVELECKPGEKKTFTIKVDNSNPDPAGVTILSFGMVAAGFKEIIQKPISSLPPNALVRHTVVETPYLTIPPRSYKEVSVTIDVPEGLTGTQYVSLSAASTGYSEQHGYVRKSEYEAGVDMGMQPAVGVTVKCNMIGTMKYALSLDKLATQKISGNEPTTLSGVIKNIGNGEVITVPALVLLNSSNQVAARLKADNRVTMVPGGSYDVSFKSLFTNVPSGKYKAVFAISDPKYQLAPITREVTVH